jgi:threonine aldolase
VRPPTSAASSPDAAARAAAETEEAAVRAGCTRFLAGHGQRSTQALLAEIDPETEPDRYGRGGVVEELEHEIAELLAKPAALFLPSGTMAQQSVLAIHAERRGRTSLVFHPACHLDWREGRGYARLHGLSAEPAGQLRRPLELFDLEAIAEPPAALLIELPQRDLGGHLPHMSDLEAMVGWARERGAAVHLDGARLFEATPFYRRSPAEIAALFDTVYVSFYKGLGGLSGCCVAGPTDVISELGTWRTRHGGTIFALWPYAASDLAALRRRLPMMPAYRDHAVSLAAALRPLPGIEVLPDPPQSPMFHIVCHVTEQELRANALELARATGIWTFARPFSSDGPSAQRLELSVGDATMTFAPDEVRDLIAALARQRPQPEDPA